MACVESPRVHELIDGELDAAAAAALEQHLALCAECRALKGDLEALALIPRMLRKRQDLKRIRKLSPREVRQLILEYRIPLKELTEQST